MTSDDALEVEDIPPDLLVVGGGYIGMELGTVYATLGSRVVVVEATESILAGADPDLIGPVIRYAQKIFREMRVKTKVWIWPPAANKSRSPWKVGVAKEEFYDRVLVSVGRAPNHEDLGLENTRIERTERGFIKVNEKQQTAEPGILCDRRHRGRHDAGP